MNDHLHGGDPAHPGDCIHPMPAFGALRPPETMRVLGIDIAIGTLTAARAQPRGIQSRGVVLLVPGFTGSKEDFYDILPLLAERGWDTWAISQRGQADSVAPQGVEAYDRKHTAEDVIEVARAIAQVCGVERVHLLGHSFGGTVAQAAVIQDSSKFSSLTLLCSGPHGWPGRHDLDRRMLLEHPGVDLWRLNNPTLADTPDNELGDQLFYRQRAERTSADQLLGAIMQLADVQDSTFALRDTGLAMMVCHGIDDPAWPQNWQRRMAIMLRARYDIIPRSAHCPNIENPQDTAAILDDFWSSVQTGDERKR